MNIIKDLFIKYGFDAELFYSTFNKRVILGRIKSNNYTSITSDNILELLKVKYPKKIKYAETTYDPMDTSYVIEIGLI